ncbi:MAG TPA: tetratricopeptide repeat protein [Pyrinomonadaceae bacterium]|nr:tetratricopeptide repeat protein [Pyrinomonadaceae bacterium]
MGIQKTYRLGEFELDPNKRLLRRDGRAVHLSNRPFRVLLYFVENRERMVTRQELLEQFWDGRDVYDVTLTKCVGAIRKALGDTTETPRFIETRWAEGYRYIGPLEEIEGRLEVGTSEKSGNEVDPDESRGADRKASLVNPPTESLLAQTSAHDHSPSALSEIPQSGSGKLSQRRFLAFAVGAVLIIGGGLLAFVLLRPAPQESLSTMRSIAVLPLKNVPDDSNYEYLSDGITESLITALSQIEGLKVISHGSVSRFKRRDADPKEVGRQLGVASILEGSVRRDGERVQVTVRLVRTEDGSVLWAGETYERSISDLSTLQDEITSQLAHRLQAKLLGGEHPTASRHSRDPEAYHLYLKGRFFWNKRTQEGIAKSIQFFNEAIARDQKYAVAYAGLAEAYVLQSLWGSTPSRESNLKAREAAEKAMVLDVTLSEPHVALALIKEQYDWDWIGAEREFKQALKLNPNYATAHQWYGEFLVFMGRTEESVKALRRAKELDPLSPIINTQVGYPYYCARQYDEAIVEFKKALELEPNFAPALNYLARSYQSKGMDNEAMAIFHKAVEHSGGSPVMKARLGWAHARTGNTAEARRILRELEQEARTGYVPACLIAALHVGLGDNEQAFAWLDKAFQERDVLLLTLNIESHLDPLRSDRRFQDLVRRVGLPV